MKTLLLILKMKSLLSIFKMKSNNDCLDTWKVKPSFLGGLSMWARAKTRDAFHILWQ